MGTLPLVALACPFGAYQPVELGVAERDALERPHAIGWGLHIRDFGRPPHRGRPAEKCERLIRPAEVPHLVDCDPIHDIGGDLDPSVSGCGQWRSKRVKGVEILDQQRVLDRRDLGQRRNHALLIEQIAAGGGARPRSLPLSRVRR